MKKSYILFISFIILISLILFFIFHNSNIYSFKTNSFYYSEHRSKPEFNISLKEENSTYNVYLIDFPSRNFLNFSTNIYGLLYLPKNQTNLPGIVFLPGGGVSKEGSSSFVSRLANLGYAVLTIDQRGIGQTSGYYLGPEQDYQVFSMGNEPIQHLSVYDGLRAFDVLREIPEVNKNNIIISGESMGGRYAIIAAALDKRIKGALIISSSGFHISEYPSMSYTPYLISIDPDHYIKDISPRPIFMLQGDNDTVVKLKDAQITFSLANEPKRFFVTPGCGHGFCEKMFDEIKVDLKAMLEQ